MNILTAINKNYTSQLNTLLKSIQSSNPKTNFDIYILNKDLTEQDIEKIKKKIETDRLNLHFKKIPKSEIDHYGKLVQATAFKAVHSLEFRGN